MTVQAYPFYIYPFPYDDSDLEPALKYNTVQVHKSFYSKDTLYLNAALKYAPEEVQNWPLEKLMTTPVPNLPVQIQNAIQFYAKSSYNHGLYFDGMTKAGNTKPSGDLYKTIIKRYGSLEEFQELFIDAALNLLGPGWVWLNSENDGNIHIAITQGNLTPLLSAITPVLVLDIWEHSYIIQYKTDMISYIRAWFSIIDWNKAETRYQESCNRQGK